MAKGKEQEEELRNFGHLIDQHSSTLSSILEDINTSSSSITKSSLITIDTRPLPEYNVVHSILINEDNNESSVDKVTKKLLASLVYLSNEMHHISSTMASKYFSSLSFYGQGKMRKQGERMETFSSTLILLLDLSEMHEHVTRLVINVLEQVEAIFQQINLKKPADTWRRSINQTLDDLHVTLLFESMAEMLTTLITMDELVAVNNLLREDWFAFQRLINTANLDPSRFGVDQNHLQALLERTREVQQKLFGQGLFMTVVSRRAQQSDSSSGQITSLRTELFNVLQAMLTSVESKLNTKTGNKLDVDNNKLNMRLVDISALLVLTGSLFKQLPDRKFLTRLWELYKKIPWVSLYGRCVWFPEQFLGASLPSYMRTVDKKLLLNIAQSRTVLLNVSSNSIQGETETLRKEILHWTVRMETVLRRPSSQMSLEELQRRVNLIIRGLNMAEDIRRTTQSLLNMHAKLAVPLTKSSVVCICTQLCLLKSLNNVFERHACLVADMLTHAGQHVSFRMANLIENAKSTQQGWPKLPEIRHDLMWLLNLTLATLLSPMTPERITSTKLTLNMAVKALKAENLMKFDELMDRLEVIQDFSMKLRETINVDFLYFHRIVANAFFNHIYSRPELASYLPYFFECLTDICSTLSSLSSSNTIPISFLTDFESEMKLNFEKNFINRIGIDVERNLRLLAHIHLRPEGYKEDESQEANFKELEQILALPKLRLGDQRIDIKECVEQSLGSSIYMLVSVSPHSWHTYDHMRSLANLRFGLNIVDDHLPQHSLEQGVDVVDVMRGLDLFVARFAYSLSGNCFVEKSFDAKKFVSALGVGNVAKSIHAHGAGIVNTTVNVCYKLVRSALNSFSQLLYSEPLKSLLAHATKMSRFDYEQAMLIVDNVSQMSKESNVLYRLRLIVTQLGNALGFVRLMHSGNKSFVLDSMYMGFEEETSFTDLAEEANNDIKEAAMSLDQTLLLLKDGLDKDFLHLLLNALSKFGQEDQYHLQNFHLALPSLFIIFVEYITAAKERLGKRGAEDQVMVINDDGLVMGVAFLLTLLHQWGKFEALNWFQVVDGQLQADLARLERQSKDGQTDQKLKQTLSLTKNRLINRQKEYELLSFNLRSARLFFKGNSSKKSTEEEDIPSYSASIDSDIESN